MYFNIEKPSKLINKGIPGEFILQQDNWNDYNYQTQYILSYTDEDGEFSYIGSVKILKKGQVTSDGLVIKKAFRKLGEDFCSVGQSLDYYERLKSLGVSHSVFEALNDVAYNPSLVEVFKNEDAWKKSLFREPGINNDFLLLARTIINRNYSSLPTADFKFSFDVLPIKRSI